MIERRMPGWLVRAREMVARTPSPIGARFAARKESETTKLYIYDMIGIDPWTGEGIEPAAVAKELEAAKGTSLEVRLNSPGGYVFDGLAIASLLQGFDGPTAVYVDGLAASIASVIALAGKRVYTSPSAMWMIHDPMGGVMSFGTADEIENDARKTATALRKTRETLVETYARETNHTVSQISAWMAGETWMTAGEALERGFTDELTAGPVAEKASATIPRQDKVAWARAQVRSMKQSGASPVKPGQPG